MIQALQKLSNGEVTPKALRDMSGSVLLLVTTTIEHMEEVCALLTHECANAISELHGRKPL